MSSVAVVGCGPAGLLAALAAEQAGHQVRVYSVKVKSPINGAQYVHELPEGIPLLPKGAVHTRCIGTAEGYSLKVYGSAHHATNWHLRNGIGPAYSLYELYDKLWQWLHTRIIERVVTPTMLTDELLQKYDVVLSSAPPSTWCQDPEHEFRRVDILLQPGKMLPGAPNCVVYNGNSDTAWTRLSQLWGHVWFEYSVDYLRSMHWFLNKEGQPVLANALRGFKPLGHNCTCQPQRGIVPVGRFGEWRPGVLTHHAYLKTREYFSGR